MGAPQRTTTATPPQTPPSTTAAPTPADLAKTGQPGAPAPADLAKTGQPGAPAPAAQKPTPADYAVDRLVIACPFCHGRDTKLVPEKGQGPGWVRGECKPCSRMFKVPVDANAKP